MPIDYTRTCFVIMPFGTKLVGKQKVNFDHIYDEIFKPAISAVVLPEGGKLKPARTDKDFFAGDIGQEMFQYLDAAKKRQAVSSDDVNDYLRDLTGREVTAKDFRTWGGTMLAAVELRKMGAAASRREADRNIIRAIDAVSERLGNTRAVCRKYYIHPALVEAYLMGHTVPQPPALSKKAKRTQPGAALRRDEVLVLQFLQEKV